MPPRLVRPGLAALTEAGREWEHEKTNDLLNVFGGGRVLGQGTVQPDGSTKYAASDLHPLLNSAQQHTFLVQPRYSVTPTFTSNLGIDHLRASHSLDYADVVPDLVQVLAAGSVTKAVASDGSEVIVPTGDQRLPLRVIDIKLTAEASVPYFGELAYYSMVLAAWLHEHSWDDRFIVTTDPAVWPGAHTASAIVALQTERAAVGAVPALRELLDALEEDLEPTEFGVFGPRVRRLLREELPVALQSPWQQLPWHVDNRCIGCEYLGYPWPGAQTTPEHCWPTAQQVDQLSRVAFVTRGARDALESQQIGTVAALATRQASDPAYDEHHLLRSTRTVVGGRATALQTGASSLPPQGGTSAVMPRWADLRLYVTADFDIGSGITIAFGMKGFYWASQQQQAWPAQSFVVRERKLDYERDALLDFLRALHAAITWAQQNDPAATLQVFVWDTVTYEHLARVVGRHLPAIMSNRALATLAWLFPPEELVPNPDITDRRNPVTRVRDVVRAVLAVPVPHYYSLLSVAREYHLPATQPPFNEFRVPSLFEDPLSDQIPSERAHEIWTRSTGSRPWLQQLTNLDRTVKVRLSALEEVTRRLSQDLGNTLGQTAPRISTLSPPSLPRRMADDARLWYVFTQLNVALSKLEVQQVLSMPAHEREGRFKSARLLRRLTGQAEQSALQVLRLTTSPNLLVYELGLLSREVRVKVGDFTFALAPEADPRFLSRSLNSLAVGVQYPVPRGQGAVYSPMEYVTQVTVRGLDRDAGLVAVELQPRWAPTVHALEASGLLDLDQGIMLDPVHRDFLLSKLKATLNAIGNPPVANTTPAVITAMNRRRRPQAGSASPAADALWDASALAGQAVPRVLPQVRSLLASNGYDLNQSQWHAWDESLSHRLRLIWGPPGTGKSRTLRTIVLGAVHEASQQQRPLRVLVCGPTYEAIDNVLLDVYATLSGATPLALQHVEVVRLRSMTKQPDPSIPAQLDVVVDTADQRFTAVVGRLAGAADITVVGSTLQQCHKLLSHSGGPVIDLFDLVVMDEASQVDVAQSTLALSGLASGGSVVIAGDPKQLSPIHQATAPEGLEYLVGSVFTYFEDRFALAPLPLEQNYRSNQTIVRLAHQAGYLRSLQPVSPDLRLAFASPVPTGGTAPSNWPQGRFWSPSFAALLDPDQPTCCFVYPEGRSSQWNHFEAELTASLAWLLWDRLANQLENEVDPVTGSILPSSSQTYGVADFWGRGLGIVTPHRAQQALVVGRLAPVFAQPHHASIRAAVDTVERFQGQQRDVMIATYALGDPDSIRTEDEFLLSLNRFNVMASRARAKLIVLVSREVVDHLSADNDVLRGSALIKTFIDPFCDNSQPLQLGWMKGNQPVHVDGEHRWRV